LHAVQLGKLNHIGDPYLIKIIASPGHNILRITQRCNILLPHQVFNKNGLPSGFENQIGLEFLYCKGLVKKGAKAHCVPAAGKMPKPSKKRSIDLDPCQCSYGTIKHPYYLVVWRQILNSNTYRREWLLFFRLRRRGGRCKTASLKRSST
jgi:hypothetical protein